MLQDCKKWVENAQPAHNEAMQLLSPCEALDASESEQSAGVTFFQSPAALCNIRLI